MKSTYGAYAAQGLGYALLVTALPSFQSRHDLSAAVVSAVLLGVCVLAAITSIGAGVLARRFSSATVLSLGLLGESLGLAGAALAGDRILFLGAIALYGLGLGLVDAGSAMRAVALQHQHGRPLLSGFFAAYTSAALLGALLMAGALQFLSASLALVIGAALSLSVALACRRSAPIQMSASQESGLAAPGRVVVAGTLVGVAFLADSAISSWSTIYLTSLGLSAAAPLGYGLYQLVVLTVRLFGNRISSRLDPVRLGSAVLGIAAVGCALLVTQVVPLVFLGLALAALSVALLVPLAFTAATAGVANSDGIVSTVNTYNYGGAVLGAVAVGGVSALIGLGAAFLLPATALVLAVPLVRKLR